MSRTRPAISTAVSGLIIPVLYFTVLARDPLGDYSAPWMLVALNTERVQQTELAPDRAVSPVLGYSFWSGKMIDGRRVRSPADKAAFKSSLVSCPRAQSAYNVGHAIAVPAYILGGVSIGCDLLMIASTDFTFLYYSLGAIAAAVPFAVGATIKYSQATDLHNAHQCETAASFVPGTGINPAANRLELTVRF